MYGKRDPTRRHWVKGLAGAIVACACLLVVGAAPAASPGAGHRAADTAGLLASAAGSVAQFAVGSPAMVGAEWIALEHWGVSPCSGVVTVAWAPLDPTVNATSNWWNPDAAYGNPAANSQCTITFNLNQDFDWPMFCTVMVHEIGHLVGQQHSTDQASVMYPTYVGPIPECAATPGGAPPAAAVPVAAQSSGAGPGISTGTHKAHNRHKTRRHHKHHIRRHHKHHTHHKVTK